MNKIMVALKI